jgi:8-oxo-dGTP diphosphatase
MSKNKRFKIFIAAYLILTQDEQILLLKRKNTGYQDENYSLVAGHLDGGETAKMCIIREAEEEAGIKLNPEALEVVHVMHRYSPEREYIDIYLNANTWEGEIINKEPEKCRELKWFSINKLPDNLIPEVNLALNKTKNKIFYGEFGW